MARLLRSFLVGLVVLVAAVALSWVVYMPTADERGVWRAQTGGSILTLSPFSAHMYSETRRDCLLQLSFPAHLKLVAIMEGARIEVSGDVLELVIDGSLDTTVFDRIDALPAPCTTADPDTATAQDVFDAMWTAMDEHYAFFALHEVDWDARLSLSPPPDANLTDAELTQLMLEALSGLDDGHVHFGTDAIGYESPSLPPDWAPPGGQLDRARLIQIARDAADITLTSLDGTGIEYGLFDDGIGYVLARHMSVDRALGQSQYDVMANAFEQVADALQDAPGLIIDVRYNPGGSDTVSFGLASHFTANPVDVFTKTTRIGDGQTEPFTATLPPRDDTPLTMPVVVLTTRLTGSAAEILTLALRELPQVTIMGERTSGGLSDVAGFKLPNGWNLGLSNQTYLTPDGALYEGVGIPPDLFIPIQAGPLIAGQDPVLDAALRHLRAR